MKHLDQIIEKIDPRLIRDFVRLAGICNKKYEGNWDNMHQDYLARERGEGPYVGTNYTLPKLARRARDRGIMSIVRGEIAYATQELEKK